MLIPVYVRSRVWNYIGTGKIFVGLSVDEPLPENFPNERAIMSTVAFGEWIGETTHLIDVGVGDHYVVVGVKVERLLGVLEAYAHETTVSMAGHTVTGSEKVTDAKRFVYIAFSVDKNGAIRIISSGSIPPGSQPITPSGGSKTLGPADVSDAMAYAASTMMQMLVPIMMINMMMQMMSAMIGMAGGLIR